MIIEVGGDFFQFGDADKNISAFILEIKQLPFKYWAPSYFFLF